MLMNALTGGLSRFVEGRHGHVLQNGDEQSLLCVDATISGMKVAALVDNGATHSFVSERTASGLHRKAECDGSLFKAINSRVKLVAGVVRSTSLTIGSWSGVLDMTVVPMDD